MVFNSLEGFLSTTFRKSKCLSINIGQSKWTFTPNPLSVCESVCKGQGTSEVECEREWMNGLFRSFDPFFSTIKKVTYYLNCENVTISE